MEQFLQKPQVKNLSGISRFIISATIIFCFFSLQNVNAQTTDLEAQFSYKQAEDAFAKDDFVSCVTFCEKAATQLKKTNQKILLLQFQAYNAQLKKDCTSRLLSDKNKIDGYLSNYFENYSTKAENEQIFEVMKFRDEWNKFKTTGCKEPKYLTSLDLGLAGMERDNSGFMGSWIYTFILEKNIFTIPDPKYLSTSLAINSYMINGKSTNTDGSISSYIEKFNSDLKEAQRSGVEKITIVIDVCLTRNLSAKKYGCTVITGSILNPFSK